MADYYQVKNQNIFNPPANTSLGNVTNQFDDVYVQNDLILGNTTVTGATINTPKVSTITYPGDDTAADTAGGQTITLTGSGFLAGASVLINGSAVGVVSVVSTTTITFTSPANSTGSYVLYVINTDGGTAIAIPGIQYSGTPTWTTAAGTLGSVYETASFNQSVTATGDAPITYSVASGSIPPGATFNSNGTITGTSQVLSSSTTYTFTVKATDAELQDTNRTFSLTINPDVVTWSSPANGTTYTSFANSAISNVTLSATSAVGSGITYTANALPTGLSLTGANILGTPTVVANSSSLLTATANTTTELANITINWVINVANDIYFEYNTLLIPGASTTFVDDDSTNNFAVTINGDTKPNNNNPYTPGYYSNYFDGGTNRLTTATSSIFNLSGSSITLECWVFMTATPSVLNRLITIGPNSAQSSLYLGIDTNRMVNFSVPFASGGNVTSGANLISLNTWTHLAFVLSGSTGTLYINGTQVGQTTGWNITSTNSNYFYLGYDATGTVDGKYTGYVSNVRLLVGTALYTSAFTPSTTPLTAIANTSLLTCQSNRFIDNSTNAFTITVNGNTSINSFDPFVPNSSYSTYGSGYFDGTGDYLTVPNNAALAFGTGAFTVEIWLYILAYNASTSRIIDWRSNGGSPLNIPVITLSASGTPLFYADVSTGALITGSSAIALNTWAHLAIVKSGSTITMYLNGTSIGSASSSINLGVETLNINDPAAGSTYGQLGYFSDLRIVKGTAVYTTAFTPPTSPLTAIANTSLLTLQNNQSVNNNVFLDNSTNNFFVTRNGNATQGTFSPYGGNWSNYFDGNGDYLSVPDNSALTFGSGDFTISGWLYPTATGQTNNAIILSKVNNIANFAPYSIAIGNGNYNLLFYATSASGSWNLANALSIGTLTPNVWNYFAVCRSGANVYLFLNGQLTTTLTNFGSSVLLSDANSTTTLIGGGNYASSYFTGYISDVRIVKGTAVYTSAFTPPTSPLTPITNTSLLTCADNRLVDDSINNLAITKNGDVSVQRFSPYNPSTLIPTSYSGYFDGTGDYLNTPSNAAFALGTGDFTIECWIYVTAAFGTTGSGRGAIISNRTAASSNTSFVLQHYNGKIYFGTVTTDVWPSGSNTTLSINTWYHVAVTRSSGTVRLFLNGVSDATAVTGDTTNFSDTSATYIGCDGSYGGPLYQYTGYISNVRIVKGTAVYTSNFTPLTSPLTAIANTSLLTCQSPTFIDNSTNNFTITAFGNSQPTQQNPFGYTSALTEGYTVGTIGGSGYFDGTGDYLTVPSSPLFQITGNVTIEAYVYATSINTFQNILSQYLNSTNAFACGYNSTQGWYFNYRNNAAEVTNYRAGASPLNTWTHVAFVKSSTTMTVYINGTALASTITVPDLPQFAALLYVSLWAGASDSPWVGYISDLRMIKGAVYTSNFVPPAQPLTAVQNSSLLLNYTSAGIYDAATMNNMETVGDAKLSTAVSKFGGSSMSFDGTGDYLSVNPNIINNLGTSDFTIEAWVYLTSGSTYQFLIGSSDNASGYMMIGLNVPLSPTSTIAIGRSGINWPVQFGAGTTITSNTWTHIAITRSGTTNRAFINGTQLGSNVTDSTSWTFPSNTMWIGTQSGGTAFNGYMDDFRITKGYARYTANFTPPTSAFPIY